CSTPEERSPWVPRTPSRWLRSEGDARRLCRTGAAVCRPCRLLTISLPSQGRLQLLLQVNGPVHDQVQRGCRVLRADIEQEPLTVTAGVVGGTIGSGVLVKQQVDRAHGEVGALFAHIHGVQRVTRVGKEQLPAVGAPGRIIATIDGDLPLASLARGCSYVHLRRTGVG